MASNWRRNAAAVEAVERARLESDVVLHAQEYVMATKDEWLDDAYGALLEAALWRKLGSRRMAAVWARRAAQSRRLGLLGRPVAHTRMGWLGV